MEVFSRRDCSRPKFSALLHIVVAHVITFIAFICRYLFYSNRTICSIKCTYFITYNDDRCLKNDLVNLSRTPRKIMFYPRKIYNFYFYYTRQTSVIFLYVRTNFPIHQKKVFLVFFQKKYLRSISSCTNNKI